VGTLGDFGTYSFFPTKNLGGFGDAGALVTNNEALYKRAKILRLHGMEPKYFHALVGGNFRLDALQAALLAVKLPHFNGYTEARRRNAALYSERLAALPGAKLSTATDAEIDARLVLPAAYPHNGHIWNQYTVRVMGPGRRDALRAHLTAKGIGSEIYYPLPLHEQACFAQLGCKPEDFPVAHRLAGEVLSLPVYPELPREELEEVCAAVGDFLAA
jgi:dTDP-4-amino-4,6-dideoxygalactose transaminase